MDLIWLGIAFLFGFAVRLADLPPLVGFLLAGFVLNALGVSGGETLQDFSDMGVTLLLFSIGLKLKLNSLARPQVWAVASLHMLVTVLLFSLGIYGLGVAGLSVFAGLDYDLALLIGFALSFSSTVFAVKVLEGKGEMGAMYGQLSIGILIMQDIAAVIFLGISAGKAPTWWAFALLGLIPLRPLLLLMLERSGHGELLILFGLVLALGGAEVFELVSVKGDLGALILGLLLANHPKASELARTLLGFKDLFLVGFFLSIGLHGLPGMEALAVALLLVAFVPLKVGLFFWLLTRFRLGGRTSFLTSLSLANYSEFGLICGAIGAGYGWISGDWMVIIALALAISFVLASPLNNHAHHLYARFRSRLKPWETGRLVPEEQAIDPGDATIAVLGMGRVGTGAYDELRVRYGDTLIGVDYDEDIVARQRAAGRNVIKGSATDADFWDRVHADHDRVGLVLLALPNHGENLFAATRLRDIGYQGFVAATAKYPDEIESLKQAGVHAAFNIYAEAGAGLAEHASEVYEGQG